MCVGKGEEGNEGREEVGKSCHGGGDVVTPAIQCGGEVEIDCNVSQNKFATRSHSGKEFERRGASGGGTPAGRETLAGLDFDFTYETGRFCLIEGINSMLELYERRCERNTVSGARCWAPVKAFFTLSVLAEPESLQSQEVLFGSSA